MIPDKDAAGFPDLVLAHRIYGVVFAELKMGAEKPRANQVPWLSVLRAAGARVYVWHPHQADAIEDVLAGVMNLASLYREAAL